MGCISRSWHITRCWMEDLQKIEVFGIGVEQKQQQHE